MAATVITRLTHLLHPNEEPTPAPRLRHLLQVTFFSLQVRGNFLVRVKRRWAAPHPSPLVPRPLALAPRPLAPRPLAPPGTKVLLFLDVSLMLHFTPLCILVQLFFSIYFFTYNVFLLCLRKCFLSQLFYFLLVEVGIEGILEVILDNLYVWKKESFPTIESLRCRDPYSCKGEIPGTCSGGTAPKTLP